MYNDRVDCHTDPAFGFKIFLNPQGKYASFGFWKKEKKYPRSVPAVFHIGWSHEREVVRTFNSTT